MFKVGDKVRRLGEYIGYEYSWGWGTEPVVVTGISDNTLYVDCSTDAWDIQCFERAGNRVVEAMVSAKVGPFKVRVWVNVDPATPLTDVRATAVEKLLTDVDDDYRDPDIGHEDTIARLQGLLEEREDVAAYEITGTDGCGFVVYPDWR